MSESPPMTSKKSKFPLKSRSWVSVGGRPLARRLADYFGFSYPQEFTSALSFFIALSFFRVITVTPYNFARVEAQHLNVVVGWAQCFVHDRDLRVSHMRL